MAASRSKAGALLLAMVVSISLAACGSSSEGNGAAGGGACHYVVVGMNGTIACSADGGTWSTRTSGTDEDLGGVAAGKDGSVVAVGNSGAVVYSADGAKTFQVATAPTTKNLEAAAFDDAGGRFVIAGADTKAYYSDDGGKTWTAGQDIDSASDVLVTDLTPDGPGRFLAAGTTGNGNASGVEIRNRVYLSTDGGDSWSSVYDGDLQSIGGSITSGLQGVATDGSQHYVTVGWKSQAFAATGDPPSGWTASSGFGADLRLNAVAWDSSNQRFVVGDNEGAMYASSDNGQGFTAVCAPLPGQSSVADIVVGGGRFLAVGPAIGIVSSDGGDSCTTVALAADNTNLLVFAGAYVP